jgi:protein O-GlcNAc transferase
MRIWDVDDEIARAREAIRLRPEELSQQIWLLALLALKNGIGAHCVRAFRELYRLAPDWTQLHYDVLGLWLDNADGAEVIAALEAESRRAARDPLPLYALGLAFQNQGEQQRAIDVFERALRLNPQMAVVHVNLGTAHNLFGRRDQAAAAWKKAAELAPEMAEPHYLLGSYYGLRQERNNAVLHCRKFLDLAYPYLEKYVPNAQMTIALLQRR